MGLLSSPPEQLVRALQWAIAVVFFLFVCGIIIWVAHLLRTSWRLGDVLSASIGISLVAIPIFVVLLSVVLYVLWEFLVHQGDR